MSYPTHCIELRALVLWSPQLPDQTLVTLFPIRKSQGIGVLRHSDCTNGFSCSSACCFYFDGHHAAATCTLIYSTAHSILPRYARWTFCSSAFLNICKYWS
ncbi:uncharacterized protein TNCV_1383691 [Trichonephila clavipes]|nr:uncharacterized protein TNCV_1383691 [Trichonephila clavipes]